MRQIYVAWTSDLSHPKQCKAGINLVNPATFPGLFIGSGFVKCNRVGDGGLDSS